MIACLDMYNWPESREIFAAYWQRVHAHLLSQGVNAPATLTVKDEDLRQLADDGELLLGQICGITYARNNAEQQRFTPLGAFICDDDELESGTYCSVLVAKHGHDIDLNSPEELTAAVNGYGSLSGWIVLAQYFSGQSENTPFSDVLISGSHRHSAEMVAQGEADIAALDIISWTMLERFAPDMTSALKVVGRTPALPGLPLVTSTHHDAETIALLKEALYQSMTDPDIQRLMNILGIRGLYDNNPQDYLNLLSL